MRTTVLAYLIALMGLVMVIVGVWDLFAKESARAQLRYYALTIGLISGGLAQALRLLLVINGRHFGIS